MTPSIVRNVVRMPKQWTNRVRTRISYMSSEQLERFLKAAKEYGPREHAMFLFAVAHGARAQEICNLRLSDINFTNEHVHIARLKGSLASTQTLLKVKGNSLFDEKAALKAWLAAVGRMSIPVMQRPPRPCPKRSTKPYNLATKAMYCCIMVA